MNISCGECSQQFNLPDEKVPQRAFSIACPACKGRIVVDPTQGAAPVPPAAAPSAAAPPAAAPQAPGVQASGAQPQAPAPVEPSSSSSDDPDRDTMVDTGTFTRLTPLRSTDLKLIEGIPPIAYVVNHDLSADQEVTRNLQKIGMEEVRNFTDVAEACEHLQENEAAIFLVRMTKASAPPCQPLEPIYKLPFDVRRKTFVALMAENVKPLDGQVAFYLQVNCLLSSQEPGAMAIKLRRALLHHLRLYRFWDVEVA